MLAGIRNTTASAYNSAQKQYIRFCQMHGFQILPTDQVLCLRYIAHLDKKGLSTGSINIALAAIRNLHIINGYPEPQLRSGKVRLAIKAISEKHCPVQKEPITFEVMKMLWPTLEKIQESLMWKAIICLGFFGGFRASEYTHGNSPDPKMPYLSQILVLEQGKILQISIKKSKTSAHGLKKFLGCTGIQICPVCTVIQYLSQRSNSVLLTNGQSLFVDSKNSLVSKAMLNKTIKNLVASLGLNSHSYSSHSLRAGAATTAAQLGLNDWEIKKLGEWKSSTFYKYIRFSKINVADLSKKLTRQQTV